MHVRHRLGLWQLGGEPLLGGDGFILDFYCQAAALAVEDDGAVHQEQVGHDEARDEILLARGIRVLRVTNNDVEGNLSAVLARIGSALVALCPRPRTGKQ